MTDENKIDQRVFDLYDEYCHGRIDRREFLSRAATLTIGGSIGVVDGSGLAAALCRSTNHFFY